MSNFYCQRATVASLVILLFILLKMYKNAEIHPAASSRVNITIQVLKIRKKTNGGYARLFFFSLRSS